MTLVLRLCFASALGFVLAGCAVETLVRPVVEVVETLESIRLPVTEPTATPQPSPMVADHPDAPEVIEATVDRVADGDTVYFILPDGSRQRTRLIGIDAPESTTEHVEVEPFGREASDYAERHLPKGKKVYLEFGEERFDRHDRLLAWVWLERPGSRGDAEVRAKMFNARMVLEGWAENYRNQPSSPYKPLFRAYESEARTNEKGMWAPLR